MSKNNELISIILPVYNAEKYLAKCLDSLKAQTFADIEILCIDDGSKDKSLAILETYSRQDSRFKVLSQPNSGPAAARNLGLKNASGTYLMFCDSDDWYAPDMCEKMYEAIQTNQTDLVICDCNVFDEGDVFRPQSEKDFLKLNFKGKQTVSDKIIGETNTVLWNKIFKMELIKQYEIDFPTGYEHDDTCFYWQYMCVSQTVYFLNEKLYNYLRRDNSIMGKMYKRTNKSTYDFLYSLEHFYHFLERNQLLEKFRGFLFSLYYGSYEFNIQFWNERQYTKARKIVMDFCDRISPELASQIKNSYPPHTALCLGNFKLFEFLHRKAVDSVTNEKIHDLRIILFNKLILFNWNIKNSVLRVKFFGLRLLKMELSKK